MEEAQYENYAHTPLRLCERFFSGVQQNSVFAAQSTYQITGNNNTKIYAFTTLSNFS